MTSKKDLTWLQQGVCCWVDQEDKIDENKQSEKQENIFQRAKVIRLDLENNVIDVEFESDKTVYEVSLDKVYECNKNEEITYEDMVDMEILNEPEILQNIKKHYKKDKIFTKIGPTLIVMNPYKYIPELFNDEIFEQIRSDSQKQNFDMSQSIPHVWSIAANSYYSLFEEDKNQAIVISGESGAGKTENTKQAMKFLTSLSENKNLFILDENEANQESSIEEKILRCNPILEAFGNAKTVQNDNSSRFGKYVRIWIDRTSKKIQGASINKYLLEKTRITTVAAGERNYHIFYHMIKGKNQEELNKYYLSNDPSIYKYLDSDCVNVAGVRDKELYEQVQASFNKLNFQKHEQEAIYSIVAAVILLGNIDFDDSQYSDTNPCSISNQELIKQIAELLQVDSETLVKCLTLKIRYIGKQTIESPLSKIDCQVQRNSFSKALYDKLFEWLVSKLNLDIQPERQSQDYLSLGLLDIFGFENFKVNSFELQQLFIEYVFKSEKKEFISEGLEDKLGNLVFKDNQHIIDFIDYKGTGLFDLLDESCALANNNDSQLLAKIQKTHEKSEALKQEKLKSVKTFTVKHTAKDVEYCIDGFRQKNLDEIVQSQQDLISNTQNNNILNIWKNQIDGVQYEETESQQGPAKRKNKSDKYLGAKFRNQMNELMGELQSCGVHFIRCLKPNELKTKGVFFQNFVMQQVRYLGLLESVKIRKEGYPLRMQYQHFYEKYREIDTKYRNIPYKKMQENQEQLKVACQDISNSSFKGNNQLQNLENDVLYGNSKIYMRFEASQILGEALQQWWKERQILLKKIQKQGRVFIFRKKVISKLKRIKEIIQKYNKLQALYKGYKQRKQYKKLQGSKRLYISIDTKQQSLMKNVFNSLIDCIKEKIFQLELQKKEKQEQERLIKEQKEKEEQERQIKEQKVKEEQERLAKEKQQKEEQLRIQKEKEELNKKQLQQEEELKNKQNQVEEIKEEAQPQQQNQEKKQIQQTQEQEQNNQQNILSSNISQSQIISHEYRKQENGLQQTWLNCQEPRDSGKIQQAQNQIENGKQLKIEDIYMAAYKNGLNSQQSPLIQQGKSTITNKSVYQSNIEQYNDPDEATELSNFEDNFIQTVEKNDFLSYCDQIIVRGANFSKSHKIEKIMTFQKNALKEPLTRCSDYAREADILFRCILKIGGNRRSRFPLSFQQNNCLSLCMGYDSLDGQEEYTVYNSQLMNTHRYANQSQNLAQKYNQNVLVPSDKGEINPQQVILRLLNGVINDKWIVLRDELYLSLCSISFFKSFKQI
ncbi:P-loop containing nucleoside triphosphate hydrolase [Pseudocohnilembus persalinus]|uniref:p-loop containing nucleoside triphosphate hydrolase n=1 Tax=Pseudocohnilembus persalinus TaxID=266149 RepID=A0A0V0QI15_PSEPJ|nr:P-loop containing nucleoside triphosphate hydrolase [Pseudocohnilembus persalinus]|eukprot:KRX01847.1 P-loop containing nucleoside triphosphate hydrolase [Pseudocohnilembus persalinus]